MEEEFLYRFNNRERNFTVQGSVTKLTTTQDCIISRQLRQNFFFFYSLEGHFKSIAKSIEGQKIDFYPVGTRDTTHLNKQGRYNEKPEGALPRQEMLWAFFHSLKIEDAP